jgi:DNA repair protein RadC
MPSSSSGENEREIIQESLLSQEDEQNLAKEAQSGEAMVRLDTNSSVSEAGVTTFQYQRGSGTTIIDMFQIPIWTSAIEGAIEGASLQDRASIKRLREKILMHGAMSLSNGELLTIVMSTGVGSENILERMQTLFENHSFTDLLRMDIGELISRHRIGEAKASQLISLLEIARRLNIPSLDARHQIRSPADAANFVMPEMQFLDHEEMRVLLLDTKNNVVGNILLYKGTVNSSVVRAAEVFRHAVARNCPGLIIFHNHPSGSPDPSPDIMDP